MAAKSTSGSRKFRKNKVALLTPRIRPGTTNAPSYSYRCAVCNATFKQQHSFLLHLTKHSDRRPFACQVCLKAFKTIQTLRAHRKRGHKSTEPVQCPDCAAVLKNANGYAQHRRSHQVTHHKRVICSICKAKVVGINRLRWHRKTVHHVRFDPKPLQCRHCKRVFRTTTARMYHVRVYHADISKAIYICGRCGVACLFKRDLLSHLSLAHTQLEPFECKTCAVSFATYSRLQKHQTKRHPKKKPPSAAKRLGCSHCLLVLARTRTLANHIFDKHTKVPLGSVRCACCSGTFMFKSGLITHLKTRHPDWHAKPFVCGACPKAFPSNLELQAHALTHTDPTPFKCVHCPIAYKTLTGLRMHMNTKHDPTFFGRFKCAKCLASFSNIQILRSHQLVHSSVRAYACACCSYACKRQRDLCKHLLSEHYRSGIDILSDKLKAMRHIRGQRRFECASCPAGFCKKVTLKRHLAKCHSNLSFGCSRCEVAFPDPMRLLRHITQLHKAFAESTAVVVKVRASSTNPTEKTRFYRRGRSKPPSA